MILHVLITMVAGWIQRNQQQVITYLPRGKSRPQSSVRRGRLHLTDTDRHAAPRSAHPLGRQAPERG